METSSGYYNVGILGCGTLGRLIAEGIDAGQAGPYRVKGVFDEYAPDNAKLLAGEIGADCCDSFESFLQLNCDYIVEAANATALKAYAVRCLEGGSIVVALSTGAFADSEFSETVSRVALARHTKVHIPSGALGGLDLAQAAAVGGNLSVTMTTEKPPSALVGAPVLIGRQLSEKQRELVFKGTALDAIAGFPKNVNVVAGLSLATVGLAQVTIDVYNNPSLQHNKHMFVLKGDFGRAKVEIEATPSAKNPKSSALAAYSVLALLKKLASPIQFG